MYYYSKNCQFYILKTLNVKYDYYFKLLFVDKAYKIEDVDL